MSKKNFWKLKLTWVTMWKIKKHCWDSMHENLNCSFPGTGEKFCNCGKFWTDLRWKYLKMENFELWPQGKFIFYQKLSWNPRDTESCRLIDDEKRSRKVSVTSNTGKIEQKPWRGSLSLSWNWLRSFLIHRESFYEDCIDKKLIFRWKFLSFKSSINSKVLGLFLLSFS